MSLVDLDMWLTENRGVAFTPDLIDASTIETLQ